MPTGIYVRKPCSEETKEKIRQANTGKHPSEETLLKMSLARSGVNNPNYDKPHSEEWKRKISETLMGYKVTEEARQKISKGHKGKHLSDETKLKIGLAHKGNTYNLGKHLSEEHKRKVGLAGKGRVFSEESKLKIKSGLLRYFNKLTKDERLERTKNWRIAAQRANPSSIEIIVCKVLDSLNIDYQRQIKIARWTADIFISDRNLVIECNGDYWHNLPERILRDAELQNHCDGNSINLLWLWEHDIRKDATQLVESKLLEANL